LKLELLIYDAVNAYEAVIAYEADTEFDILPLKYEAVPAFCAYEALSAYDEETEDPPPSVSAALL